MEGKDQKLADKQKGAKSKKLKPQRANTGSKKDEVSKNTQHKDSAVKEKHKENEPTINTEGRVENQNKAKEKNTSDLKESQDVVPVKEKASVREEPKVKQNVVEFKGKTSQIKSKDHKTIKNKKNEPKIQSMKQISQCKSIDNLMINEVIGSHHRDSLNTDDTKMDYHDVSESRSSNASKQSKASDLHSDMQSQHSNEDSSDQKQDENPVQKHYNSIDLYSDEQGQDYHKEETSVQFYDQVKDPETIDHKQVKPSSY